MPYSPAPPGCSGKARKPVGKATLERGDARSTGRAGSRADDSLPEPGPFQRPFFSACSRFRHIPLQHSSHVNASIPKPQSGILPAAVYAPASAHNASPALPTLYTCPGEEHPVSRAVHLARLAAFYPNCRNCTHRSDTGQLPRQTLERLRGAEHRVERPTLFTDEGLRGVYLNELTRTRASLVAAAFASLLWDSAPLKGRAEDPGRQAPLKRSPRRGPAVVVGCDERPSSPDIVTGIASSLRRMGCQVIDVGVTAAPCFSFAVDHLQAAGGVFVTGAGRPPSWTGLDFVGSGGKPYSTGAGLEEIEERSRRGCQRPTRQATPQRTFQALIPYEAGLWKHFHALRPLRVCCGCPTRLAARILERVFARLPCQLDLIALPQRPRDVSRAEDPDVHRVAAKVRAGRHHLGAIIDDDGRGCGLLDERGEPVSSRNLTRILAQAALEEHRGPVVIESTAFHDLAPVLESFAPVARDAGTTAAALWQAMEEYNGVLGGGDSGRFWFREAVPVCDAILTLAKTLQALSRSDAPFSELVAAR